MRRFWLDGLPRGVVNRPWLAVTLLSAAVLSFTGCGTTTPHDVHTEPVRLAPRQQRGSGGPVRPPAPRVIAPEAWGAEAETWMGTPYKVGGMDRTGIDCSGFAYRMQERLAAVRLPRMTLDQFRSGRAVARRDLKPGDLVFFDTTGSGVSHVGVMVDVDQFAHASSSKGVTYSRLSEDYWNRRYLGARRVP